MRLLGKEFSKAGIYFPHQPAFDSAGELNVHQEL
jgi:hypothetical protein